MNSFALASALYGATIARASIGVSWAVVLLLCMWMLQHGSRYCKREPWLVVGHLIAYSRRLDRDCVSVCLLRMGSDL